MLPCNRGERLLDRFEGCDHSAVCTGSSGQLFVPVKRYVGMAVYKVLVDIHRAHLIGESFPERYVQG
ncbi:hypothetical protein Vid5_gp79 [Pantoea phage vB_PagS_Vid5]|uniref:Uncharacterized protein n=1 Tax=Pantoea phage vB_PagS_Vid5 TaxID=2099652 RepID=A0A2P1CKY4_9CAUD|nr:hypothetical protein FDJ45_gp076 [Pantoea phage vB_PagS_Vid5]AVJ51834.1 hypothetical protein Vid5_gp79 [Pantoea phage vB_PagS_Vid5]